MKIGILTYHAAYNCGSMLQAFALQETLEKKYGADVEIINFSNRGQRQFYALWDTHLRPNILKLNLKALPYWKQIKINNNEFIKFKNQRLKIKTPLLKKYGDLIGIDKKYDIVVVGGDQVWNVICRDADKAYFLPFVKDAIKVSYSPSLGSVQIGKYVNKEEYRKYIEDFDYISVREPNGKKWLQEITTRDIQIVADPTMVMTKEEWEQCIPINDIKQKFIFYYGFDFANSDNNRLLQNISKKVGLPIYIIDRKSWYMYNLAQYDFVLYEEGGPYGFLKMIKNAEIVFAKSFHGIAFSLVFNKNFWAICNRELKNPLDDRARHILKMMDIPERFMVLEDLDENNIFQKIDYQKVNVRMDELRKNAYAYMDLFMK